MTAHPLARSVEPSPLLVMVALAAGSDPGD
jgi:hypothetical protein